MHQEEREVAASRPQACVQLDAGRHGDAVGDGKVHARTLGVLRLIAAAATGYVGTIPSADTAARLATRGATDLRDEGSGNPGAVNAMAVLGKGWGYGVLVADVAKGAVACAVGRRLAGDAGAHLGGTAAVVGHCLPVWKRFRGGKGVAASAGQCLATFPAYFPLDLGVAWATAAGAARRWRPPRQLRSPGSAPASCGGVGLAQPLGPAPSAAFPLAAAASSGVIMAKFVAAR